MEYFCKYCGKKSPRLSSLHRHEARCKYNAARIPSIPAWNKGLSKFTDSRIKESAKKLHERFLSGQLVAHQKGKPRTTVEKLKISAAMKKNPNAGGLRIGSGRGKKGYYKGHYCDSTYELVYIIYNLDHNIVFNRCPRTLYYEYLLDNKIKKYYPDFILPDGSLVEIKGYHDSIVDLKLASVKDRNIKILYEKDLKYAFDYVKATYNYSSLADLYDSGKH